MNKPATLYHEILAAAECLHDAAAIEKALDKMGKEISAILKDKNPIILCVMVGALIPTGHLVTRLNFPLTIDFVQVTRYRGTTRGGDLHWMVEPRQSLKGRSVLIVDDVLDGGLTLAAIKDYCNAGGASEVLTAVMVNKIRKREPGIDFEVDFVGLETPDKFLVGFGLDYDEYLRNLPGIYAIAPEHQ